MSRWPTLHERPETFRLNAESLLSRGLVFAGLGQFAGAALYADSSWLKNNGTLTGFSGAGDTPADRWQWNAYLRRRVLSLDGSNDYVGAPRKFSLGTEYTIAGWARIDGSLNVNYGRLASWYDGATNYQVYAYQDSGLGSIYSWNLYEGSLRAGTGANSWTVGLWRHVAFMRGPAGYRAWLDGSPVSGSGGSITAYTGDSTTLYLGQKGGGVSFLPGTFADLQIWTRDLMAAEIAALADPSNVDLRVGGVPLILPPRRRFFASTGPEVLSAEGGPFDLYLPVNGGDPVGSLVISGGVPPYSSSLRSLTH